MTTAPALLASVASVALLASGCAGFRSSCEPPPSIEEWVPSLDRAVAAADDRRIARALDATQAVGGDPDALLVVEIADSDDELVAARWGRLLACGAPQHKRFVPVSAEELQRFAPGHASVRTLDPAASLPGPAAPGAALALRRHAASLGCGRVLLFDSGWGLEWQDTTWLGLLYPTLLGLALPGEEHRVQIEVAALVLDVRTGAFLWEGTPVTIASRRQRASPLRSNEAVFAELTAAARLEYIGALGAWLGGEGRAVRSTALARADPPAVTSAAAAAPPRDRPLSPPERAEGWASRRLLQRVEDAALRDLGRALGGRPDAEGGE